MLGLANIYTYKKNALAYILVSCVLYLWFAYDLERTEGSKLILLYGCLFFLGFQIIKTSGFYFRVLVLASILFRVLFLFAIPNLSQDFYRFIWDGQLLLEGFNPYLYKPYDLINGAGIKIPMAQELYNGMGPLNASHFTNYPPLNQLCFALGNLFPGKDVSSSVIGMRLIIIAADLGTLYLGKKLLEALKLPSNRIFWYILNPLIIIELTGNLHFEGVMIFFLVWSLYLLHKGHWKWAAVTFACSVSIKLIPLMFLPLFFWWFVKNKRNPKSKEILASAGISKLFVFYAMVGITTLMFFLPFFSMEFISNYSKTVALWFTDFEFNASIYYVLRAIGYAITGYNEIGIIGKVLPIISVLIILGFSFLRKNNSIPKLSASTLLVFTIYLFLSTTVHPWYIATLIIFCVFTHYKFPLVWSLVIVFSYLAYLGIGSVDKSENLWIIALEYLIVFLAFIWEVFLKKRLPITLAAFKF
ncbi:MAG: DUF2029 domain-containing protein [Winogradskyella sp.]